ncbi:MAG: hypothetical protein JNK64_34785 [Myxococcales bacterium]|nr:hypothetical protein [Myxococcales bacterium]
MSLERFGRHVRAARRGALSAALAAAACGTGTTALAPPLVARPAAPRSGPAAGEFMLLADVPGVAPRDLARIAPAGVGFIGRGRRLATATLGHVALVEPAQAADWMCVAPDGARTLLVDGDAVLEAPRFGAAPTRLGTLRDVFEPDGVIYERDGVVTTATCATPAEVARPELEAARFVTASRLVAVADDGDGALIGLDLAVAPAARAWQRIGPYARCAPIAQDRALFQCAREARAVVVRVDPDGVAREELDVVEDPARNELRDGIDVTSPEASTSGDGGVALLGSCDGARRDAACVRRPDGTWATRAAAPALIAAIVRFHPFAPDDGPRAAPPMLLPTPAGELFAVVTPRRDRDRRAIARVGAPGWGAVRGLPDGFFADVAATEPARWSTTATGFRAWPLVRGAGAAVEACAIDVDLRGQATSACAPGPVWASGLVGVRRLPDGGFVETSDAGRTWQPLAVPPGWDAAGAHVACVAVGCTFGIYLRLGWGARASSPHAGG